MPDYQKSKIYRLVCNITGKQYIGSTVNQLNRRKAQHKEKYNKWKEEKYHYVSSFEIIKNNDYDIVLIEEYPCGSKEQLHSRERFHIENNECVNLVIPSRTHKEWYEENKEKQSGKWKEHYEKHKEVIKQKSRDYHHKNRNAVLQTKKKYYDMNKEQLNSKRKQEYSCECGATLSIINNKSRHEKTQKHQDYIKSLEQT